MVFSSVIFLCVFFPIVFILHTILPNGRIRNAILILASILFYAFGEPVYVILLLVSVLLNYLLGLGVSGKGGRFFLACAVIINIGLLVVFKYAGFLATSINEILPADMRVPVPKLNLPIGISFYTFQALSYVIDVYRKQVKVQKNPLRLLLYISFFPQLIAGPIVKYHDIETEIRDRKVTVDGIWSGIVRFSVGLGKKVLIANTMAFAADKLFALETSQVGVLAAWIAAFAYVMQIYFDFSGYSDMAIGLGLMFGFHFQENFNYPYISGSITEFWRRWHISLSTWFRDYLYIPLGGNRKGEGRTIFNKFVVFFCTGFWHGANWTFLVWGLFHGILEMFEEKKWIPVHKKIRVFNHIYTLLMVTVGFVMFRADTLKQGIAMIGSMFGVCGNPSAGYAIAVAVLSPYMICMCLCAILGATPLFANLVKKIKKGEHADAWVPLLEMLFALIIFGLAMMALASDSYNPFIYFRF